MKLPRLAPAVYHCAVPIKPRARDAVRELRESGEIHQDPAAHRRSPPFAAWPEIRERWRWLSFPSLMRASYSHVLPRTTRAKAADEREGLDSFMRVAVSYLEDHREEFDPLDLEPAIAGLRSLFDIVDPDQITESAIIARLHQGIPEEVARSLSATRVAEVLYQGFSFAHAQNDLSPEDTFSFAHEDAHFDVAFQGNVHSARLQEKQASLVHMALQRVVTTPESSAADLEHYWRDFVGANRRLVELVQRFESIEEVAANFLGLCYLTPEIRERVEQKVTRAMRALGLYEDYLVFADACNGDSPVGAAFDVLDLTGRAVDFLNMVPGDALRRITTTYKSAVRDKRPRSEATESLASAAPVEEEIISGDQLDEILRGRARDNDLSARDFWQENLRVIMLVGSGNVVEVEIDVPDGDANVLETVRDRGFFESLRQQITQQRSGLCCPYARSHEPCCGRGALLGNLWTRLPRQNQDRFTPPTCSGVS